MIKDRLKELQNFRRNNKLPLCTVSEEVTIEFEGSSNDVLISLLNKIAPLYTRVKTLKKDVIELRKGLHDHSNRQKLTEKISDVKCEASSLLKSIKEVNSYIENESILISHVAKTHHSALVTFFLSANTELAYLQIDLRERHKGYVEKELRITGQEVTDEELECLLEKSAQIFNQNILNETKVAKQRMLDVQQRHDEILKIEKSIVEVHELFRDLALLTEEQGEKVDRIENFVFEAKEYANKGKMELTQAVVSRTKARKKKLICIGILVVVVIVIILILVFSF